MSEKEGATFNIIGTIVVLTYMVLFSIIAGIVGIFMPLTDQVSAWAAGATVPPRDFLWLLADKSCPATNWVDMGWSGKDLCRTAAMEISESPEVNQALNFVLDFNVPMVTAILLLLMWRLVFFLMEI